MTIVTPLLPAISGHRRRDTDTQSVWLISTSNSFWAVFVVWGLYWCSCGVHLFRCMYVQRHKNCVTVCPPPLPSKKKVSGFPWLRVWGQYRWGDIFFLSFMFVWFWLVIVDLLVELLLRRKSNYYLFVLSITDWEQSIAALHCTAGTCHHIKHIPFRCSINDTKWEKRVLVVSRS